MSWKSAIVYVRAIPFQVRSGFTAVHVSGCLRPSTRSSTNYKQQRLLREAILVRSVNLGYVGRLKISSLGAGKGLLRS